MSAPAERPAHEAGPFCLAADLDRGVVGDAELHHLLRARRLRTGETVVLVDGAGGWRPGVVDGETIASTGEVRRVEAASSPLCVAFPPIKGDRPEWAVQKLTEIGVDRIELITTRRTVVHWKGVRAERQRSRLRRVAQEAAIQARRLHVPEIVGPVPLESLWARAGTAVASPGGGPLTSTLTTVVVGPEGGWDPDELSGEIPQVGLGEHVLRVETAAVVAGTLMTALRAGMVVRHAE